jgi:hypothetical protein
MPREPSEIAASYRVRKIGAADFELIAGSNKLRLTRRGAHLHFNLKPCDLRWNADEGCAPYYAVHFDVTELEIGSCGDEGWSSSLVDNCIFVINGETLEYVPLSKVSVVSEEEFKVSEAENAANMGKKLESGGWLSDPPFASAHLCHFEGAIYCRIGLVQFHFDKLVEGCLNGRINGAQFFGTVFTLTSSFEHGAARDIVICAKEDFYFPISSLSFKYHV